jgi:hypothetical protein
MSVSDTECDDDVAADANRNSLDGADRIAVPGDYFKYVGAAAKDSNSLYRCMKCSRGPNKTISCSDRSRLNLKKHMKVLFNIIKIF